MTTVSLPDQTSTYNIQASSNPITFDSATNIYVTSGNAVYGDPGTAWNVTNDGEIRTAMSGGGTGIVLKGGGVVDNGAGGTISNTVSGVMLGFGAGVYIDGGTGAVINAGSIYTGITGLTGITGQGVYLQNGGSVTNLKGGVITGGSVGVEMEKDAGVVTNAGTITGTGKYGVALIAGGTVANLSGGAITGGSIAVYLDGGGSVTNAGTITASGGTGVSLKAGGAVTNEAGGEISGNNGVIIFNDTGGVTNAGTITGTNGQGVYLRAAGTVTNAATADITGTSSGVEIAGQTDTLTNAGTITASAGAGVILVGEGAFLVSECTVTNEANADISGESCGANIAGLTAALTNWGTITASAGIGVVLEGVGEGALLLSECTVTNEAKADISGASCGAEIAGLTVGALTNWGTITASAGIGVLLVSEGTVTNEAKADISGTSYGAEIAGPTAGALTNMGTIQASAGMGVYLETGGMVTNAAKASIYGTSYGVKLVDGGSLTNAGAIKTTAGTGVYLAGGTVTNSGTIGTTDATVNGIVLSATTNCEVTNSGTINGTASSVTFGGSGQNTLVLETGSTLNGAAFGSTTSTTNALILQGAGTAGNVFENFNTLTVGVGAVWTLSANSIIGQTTINGGSLTVAATGGLTGAITLENKGAAQLTLATSDSVIFSGIDAGALTLGASDSGTISGFGYGDKIVFKSATYSAAEKVAVVADASNPGDDTVTITNGAKTNPSTIASFTVAGDYTAANFTLGKAAGGGIAVGYKIGTGGQLIGEGSDAETVTVAQYLANQSLLDKDSDGFTISDTAADIEKLTAAELSGKTAAGPVTLYASDGVNVTLTAAQTKAITADHFLVTAASGATVTESFADGGSDVIGPALTGMRLSSYEDLYTAPTKTSAATLCAQAVNATSGNNLILFGDGLTMSSSSAGLSVTSGADTSQVATLSSSSSETIWANGQNGETFKFASGFGGGDIEGFLVAGATSAPADTLDLDTKMFKGLTSTNAATDLAALIKGNELTFSDGVVTLTDTAKDTLTLGGFASLSAFQSDPNVKFFTK